MKVLLYLMTDFDTHITASCAINQFTGMAMIPMLILKLSLGLSKGTQGIIKRFIFLRERER